jgi:hypothetical protein
MGWRWRRRHTRVWTFWNTSQAAVAINGLTDWRSAFGVRCPGAACRTLARSGYTEQPRALALGKATNEIALKVATEAVPAC